ncbi:hypothetical protein [Clostridium sp. YIM B02506]|uniref:hypothetical protein n=1 Tax=Clostridium sp. YIM B02506 TaxID=2910680 RepID=UPI001EEDD324|nr:hypothetical protein [Clostridium sp. YIM B02506]
MANNRGKEELLKEEEEEKLESVVGFEEDKDAKFSKNYNVADLVREKLGDSAVVDNISEGEPKSEDIEKTGKKSEVKSNFAHEVIPEMNNSKLKKNFWVSANTIRMINELRAVHPNANVKFGIIVENAVEHYYKYIKEEGGTQM